MRSIVITIIKTIVVVRGIAILNTTILCYCGFYERPRDVMVIIVVIVIVVIIDVRDHDG
jgi:hypothetical protein